MSSSQRVAPGRRGPLLVLALVLAGGLALLAVEHQRAHRPPALTAPAERAAPRADGGVRQPPAAPASAR